MPTIPGKPAKHFDYEVRWFDAKGAKRSAKAIGFHSPVKARVMAKALAAEMGCENPETDKW